MRGAQYLHRPIPGLSGDPFDVEYQLWGTVDGYRKKVYGDMGDILVSPETLVGISEAWDIREAYDAAWEFYSEFIQEYSAWDEVRGWDDTFNIMDDFDIVISTIPAHALCADPSHNFNSERVWVTEDLKRPREMGFHGPDGMTIRDNLVVCSGDPDDWWYRQSRINGWENTEFPRGRRPNFEGKIHEVEKPLDTDCDCFPRIVRMGRYGKWKKGVLSDSAFYETKQAIEAKREQNANK